MIVVRDRAEIVKVLERYRSFEECLLKEVRTVCFGTGVELRFDYIWSDEDPEGELVSDNPRPVTLRLDVVHDVRFVTALPPGIHTGPERANWGLSEVALVRLKNPSDVGEAHRGRSDVPLCHLVVDWEGDRRLDVVFERFTYFEEP